jgi:hypothetical protein
MARQLTNDFSWSKSRHELMSGCLRAYYLSYYRSWGGWERGAAPEVQQLYGLKKLHNRFTWAGSAVHDAVKEALLHYRARRPVDPAEAIERVHRKMKAEWKHSHDGKHWQDRKTFAGLREHEYREALEPEVWKRNWELTREALACSVFYLDGVKVFAVPDFAYFDEDGAPRVVDWKTGNARDGYDAQVLGYALYLSERYGLPLERIRTSLVYLNAGVEKEVPCTPEAVEGFKALFRDSVGRMRVLLADAEKNVPRGEEAFPQKEDPAGCSECVFRRPCGREAFALKSQVG